MGARAGAVPVPGLCGLLDRRHQVLPHPARVSSKAVMGSVLPSHQAWDSGDAAQAFSGSLDVARVSSSSPEVAGCPAVVYCISVTHDPDSLA